MLTVVWNFDTTTTCTSFNQNYFTGQMSRMNDRMDCSVVKAMYAFLIIDNAAVAISALNSML